MGVGSQSRLQCAVAVTPLLGTGALALASKNNGLYTFLTREDSIMEWLQVLAYLAAAGFAVSVARRTKPPVRAAYGLVVVAALLAVGEELSWGQRLFSFEGYDALTSANNQRELNVHNLREVGRGSQIGLVAAGVYGALVPFLVARSSRAASLVPPRFLVPAFSLVAVYNAGRLAVGDAASFELAKFSEWPELCFAAGVAVTLFLAARHLRDEATVRQRSGAVANSRTPSANETFARNPSSAAARSVEAKT